MAFTGLPPHKTRLDKGAQMPAPLIPTCHLRSVPFCGLIFVVGLGFLFVFENEELMSPITLFLVKIWGGGHFYSVGHL